MKKLIVAFLMFNLSAVSSAETCKDLYAKTKWGKIYISHRLDALVGTTAGGFALGGFVGIFTNTLWPSVLIGTTVGPVIILGSAGAAATAVVLHNSKPNKMIKLIDQSVLYAKVGGVPGKQLFKLWKKLHGQYTLRELAEYISSRNDNLSLCSVDLISFHRLKNMMRDGELHLLSEQ